VLVAGAAPRGGITAADFERAMQAIMGPRSIPVPLSLLVDSERVRGAVYSSRYVEGVVTMGDQSFCGLHGGGGGGTGSLWWLLLVVIMRGWYCKHL
jgi:hypothetical protein